jgi:protein-tyrosine kinase
MGRVDEAMRRAAGVARDGGADILREMPLGARAVLPDFAAAVSIEPAAAPDVVPESPSPAVLFEHLDAGLAEKVVVDVNMKPASREQYRRLAAVLHQAQADKGLKVIMIASAVEGEGKTLTAANLALTLSESYHRSVLLIDADLRRPSLHTAFKVNGSPGLSEGLASSEDQKLPVHQVSPRLAILPAGKPSADPMAGLTSPRMRHIVDEAREAFAWVIIDTPPIGLLSDASLLTSIVDSTILVVKADSTPYDLVKRAAEAIGSGRMLGILLNRARPQTRRYGHGYYNYVQAATANGGKPR